MNRRAWGLLLFGVAVGTPGCREPAPPIDAVVDAPPPIVARDPGGSTRWPHGDPTRAGREGLGRPPGTPRRSAASPRVTRMRALPTVHEGETPREGLGRDASEEEVAAVFDALRALTGRLETQSAPPTPEPDLITPRPRELPPLDTIARDRELDERQRLEREGAILRGELAQAREREATLRMDAREHAEREQARLTRNVRPSRRREVGLCMQRGVERTQIREGGSVTLEIRVDARGTILPSRVLSATHPRLGQICMQCLTHERSDLGAPPDGRAYFARASCLFTADPLAARGIVPPPSRARVPARRPRPANGGMRAGLRRRR